MARIRERNKNRIIEAASEVFADKGFAATKTIDIATKAGLPKANVYYYFKSKENLYRSVLETIVEPLLEAAAPFHLHENPVEALKEYVRAKIRISQQHSYASKVFASEIMHGAPHLPDDIGEQLLAQARGSVARIQSWIDQGLMAPVDPEHLLFTIWASTQTYADFDWQISMVTGKDKLSDSDYEAAADLIVQMVLKGCEVKSPEQCQEL
ncbi:TetR/AcrR family transcriptional regulator [Motiliproteus sp. MSK22-1]|uniref:TetR/AcrR family transcriptional regulator n=1 Tax=Motiliproteus sp. MSK22-1 TaxID=1897630 RepID=UPI0009782C6A|nr:TetR/AcrR family transcriptional regulator [Motiliproteus sp. MSK22-1]OMH39776.1 TetR family transcriptional regulator [Motiliproteus sp. MSK22-1]